MPDIWFDVDAALSEVPITLLPLLDDTDFKSREESVVYNQAGLDLVWNFETTAGVMTQTPVTPTDTAGDYDWVNQGNGLYTIEMPASGGGTINNDTEGFGWFSGFATGILPWRGPVCGFRKAALNNMLIDGVAWTDNLELQYDTTGLTGDTFPATQSQVGNIGSASGGSLSFQVETDNAITDTIDNAAAVDKGSGLVGIPVTGHAFTADFQITIAGSTNYNNAYTIVSETTNEVVITETYAAETFGGSETIISTIKTIAKVGTEAGTFANAEALDATYHILTNAGDNLDWVYQIDVGGGRTASLVNFHGYLTGNNDTVNIQAYDFVGSDWETRAVLQGTSQTTNQTLTIPLLSKHTGLTGADIGKVLIRFVDATAAGHVLGIDELLIEAVGIGQTVGYANGQIWTDTNNGTAGTEAFVNGVADKPSLTIADTKTLSTATGISDFHIINGSSITLAESTVNESYFGDNWALALGGQDVDGAYFQGASVTGVGTSATKVHYEGCDVGTMSVQIGHFDFCSFDGTVTQTLAGDYEYHNCYSNIAGVGAPTFTKTAGQAITAEWRNWMDSITVSGLQSGDTITINGRLGTVTLNGADATVEIRGSYKSIVNNLTGSPTVNTDGAWRGSNIIMTAYAGPHGPGVYLDDAAANTGTTNGEDGTIENPVSTIAAATTIASSLGLKLFYLVNDSAITLAQTYEDHRFVGLGVSNKVTLGSQDVDNSEFFNVILTGTQGGTGQMRAIGCSLSALVSAEIIAESCWLSGNITLRAYDNHMFKDCCSAVEGQATPDLTFPGSGTTEVSFRNYSGGLTVKSATANDTMSFETDGQIIIDASCTSLTISVRGNCQITDNGTTTSLTDEAAINRTNINAEMVDVMDTDTITLPGQIAPPLAPTHRQAISWLYKVFRNRKTQTATQWSLLADDEATVDAKATISDDATTAIKQEVVTGP